MLVRSIVILTLLVLFTASHALHSKQSKMESRKHFKLERERTRHFKLQRGKHHRVYTLSSVPYTAVDYISNSIGWGFDTDFFKSSSLTRNYSKNGTRMMTDLYNRGVRHLRLRSRADIFGYSTDTFDEASMNAYLSALELAVTDMLNARLFPIVSWIHHKAETQATVSDGNHYVDWWRRVALRMRDYDYALSFNLFTELGDGNLRNPTIYNNWTKRAITAIRFTGGRNVDRIIILGAPAKDPESLWNIDPAIYNGSSYLAAESHLYASGPNKDGGRKNWVGTGSASDRANVDKLFNDAAQFSGATNIPVWIGAWMPYDNIGGSLSQFEVKSFGCYFTTVAARKRIPWAMNKLENFYDIKQYLWVQSATIGGSNPVTLDMPSVLLQCTQPCTVQ